MAVDVAVEAPRLLVASAAARAAAADIRRDALAANWRAAGTRQAHQDLRTELAWTVFQQLRRREGLRPVARPIRTCGQPGCTSARCGRPPH